MPGLKSVTHVSDTSVTYVSGLYTRQGRGNIKFENLYLLGTELCYRRTQNCADE
jgi:hypothetical protein